VGIMGFNGCCTVNMQGACRQRTLYCSAVAGEKYSVRIAIGKWNGENHVQAQALIDNNWEYLKQSGTNVIKISKPEGFKVMGYMNLEKYTQTLFRNQVNHDTPKTTLVSP
jgi:hypothetical protein